MEFSRWKNFLIVFIILEILAVGCSYALNDSNYFDHKVVVVSSKIEVAKNAAPVYVPPQKLSNPPTVIKAVYVTGYSAGTKKYLDYLTDLFKNTEINAVVLDIKGSDGSVSYASGAGDVEKYSTNNGAIKDIDALINFFHDKNIYVIGRIADFEDPVYSKARPELAIYNKTTTTDLSKPVLWKDNNGLSWLDPASKDAWGYNLSLAKDAFYHGFDEINFDYIRFPSDGKAGDMGFPAYDGKTSKADIINNYFHFLRTNLPNEKISADLFGQTTSNTDDMGIGQIIENAFENFDYISPMVYPSHYINGFLGFDNPADHPYDLVKYEMITALKREKQFENQKLGLTTNPGEATTATTSAPANTQSVVLAVPLAKFRPWLQDFDMGADYTADMIKLEITGTQDGLVGDYNGFMLWNAANRYTQGAVLLPKK